MLIMWILGLMLVILFSGMSKRANKKILECNFRLFIGRQRYHRELKRAIAYRKHFVGLCNANGFLPNDHFDALNRDIRKMRQNRREMGRLYMELSGKSLRSRAAKKEIK